MGPAGIEPGPNAVRRLHQRKLGLVAVAGLLRRGDKRGLRYGDTADAPHILIDKMLLVPAFLLIGDMPQAAAAAFSIHRAEGLGPGRRGGEDLLDDAVAESFLYLDDPHPELVADGTQRDKDSHSLIAADSHRLCGEVGDRQGDDVIFLQHTDPLVPFFGGEPGVSKRVVCL